MLSTKPVTTLLVSQCSFLLMSVERQQPTLTETALLYHRLIVMSTPFLLCQQKGF